MKATLILTTLLGAAIASPVAIANVDANQVEKRDLEVRVLSGNPITSLIPNGIILANLSLPAVPTGAITNANVIEILTQLLQSILGAILNIRQGTSLPNQPTVPTIPGLPTPVIPSGGISAAQLTGLTTVLQPLLKNVTDITQNLPTGLTSTQKLQALAILTVIKTQLAALITGLSSGSGASLPNGITAGAVPGVSDLASSVGTLDGVVKTVTGIVGAVLAGVVSLLGGSILSTLPIGR
ncbi:uncharacterized protein ColSpa_02471 [Colletotrichum spaethianum]|uniref:Cell wall protein n=1 Tax=Colletotrichum spaethianum TaxID=700344 RepID=A0AA37NXF9_9PEZI|nr:uncharacterized protein ColSpa_02471 [Colletotrichum spaethianum]GKT42290.1 hypothetical protein ColSpa_02471 [Colletotrichum spaethianum]